MINFAFFGSSEFSVVVLDTLKKVGVLPSFIVTLPDSPSGRGLKLTPSVTKLWAIENKIAFLEPSRLDSDFLSTLNAKRYTLFLVAAYGKIIPHQILEIPKFGSFNIHPSLLPKYRGPSPLQSQILADEKEVGVTIIKMDERVDSGEILRYWIMDIGNYGNWPISYKELGDTLFKKGAEILAESLSRLERGEIKLSPQDDSKTTFTRKYEKKDGEIDLSNGRKAWLTFQALSSTVGVFFFVKHGEKRIRVKITAVEFRDNKFTPIKVIPEGKKEMGYEDFRRGMRP